MKLLRLLPLLLLPACTNLTPAQKDLINSRIVALAASRGVTPTDTKMVLDLVESTKAAPTPAPTP